MEKILATILAFVYLSTSMGATVHLHYCMGKLMSWGLIDKEGKNCATCGKVKKIHHAGCVTTKMGCCKDEHKQIKTDRDQKAAKPELQISTLSPDASETNRLALPDVRVSSFAVEYPTGNAPPGVDKVPVFLLNRNFRI